MRAEHEARVVRDVQPFVRVGRPRVGAFDAVHQRPEIRRCRSPETERTVDVQPRARRFGRVGDLGQRVDRPGVHLADLGADDRRAVAGGECRTEAVRVECALRLAYDDGRRSEPEQAQRAVDGDVTLRADQDADARRARQAVPADVPAGAS